PLCGEVERLALERLAGDLAAELEVFQLVALEGEIEAQLAFHLAARAQQGLVGAEEGAELDRDGAALANGAGCKLDILQGELLAIVRIAVVDARIAQGQAVDIQLQRLTRRLRRRLGRGLIAAFGLAARRRGRGVLRRFADAFPVATALVVALQVEAQPVDADI